MNVPFSCPACDSESATLIGDTIFASLYEPCLRCDECGTLWRINLYDVIGEGEE